MDIPLAMAKGDVFWIIMLVVFLAYFGFYGRDRYTIGCGVIAFILFSLIGWQVFGAPIQ